MRAKIASGLVLLIVSFALPAIEDKGEIEGAASPCGLVFGPGGLYFTDLHGEKNGLTNVPAGNIYWIRPAG